MKLALNELRRYLPHYLEFVLHRVQSLPFVFAVDITVPSYSSPSNFKPFSQYTACYFLEPRKNNREG